MNRKTSLSLFILIIIVFSTSCNPKRISPTPQANMPNPASVYCEQQGNRSEIVTAADFNQKGVCIFPDGSTCDEWAYFRGECGPVKDNGAPSKTATATMPTNMVINEPLGYCFIYPQGFRHQIYKGKVEVVGSDSGSGSRLGLVWIDATDAQGRTAQEIADEDVKLFGGSPQRLTVMLDGEDALVLDGMPGQDFIRKTYIVHNGTLYTLNFSPTQSDDETANAQMETLFASVTSSWEWMSPGKPCTASD